MALSPPPVRTDFLERDQLTGKLTGKVSWPWIKWLMEQRGTPPPFDVDNVIGLTIQEPEPFDVTEEAAMHATLATQVESPAFNEALAEQSAWGMTLALENPRFPREEYVNGELIKSQSITTGSVAASTYASLTLTWTTPFWDANYLAYAAILEGTASANTLRVHHIESVAANKVIVGVYNDDAGGAHTGVLHVLAIHN